MIDMESEVKQMHKELENVKNDIKVIKHILSEEGELSEEAKKELEEARLTPDSKYTKL